MERLGAGRAATVEVASVVRFSSKGEIRREPGAAGAVFDVAFHDPPFKEISSESDLHLLLSLISAGGWLLHERGDDRVFSPGGLAPADVRRYGHTRFLIYRP